MEPRQLALENYNSDDIVVGICILFTSLLSLIPNLRVMNAIWVDVDLYRLTSYKFMFALCIFDIPQLLAHAVTGVTTIWPNIWDPLLAKINRLLQISASKYISMVFGNNAIYLWYAVGITPFVCFATALATPWATIHYLPNDWCWSYDYAKVASRSVQLAEMVFEIGSIIISVVIYTAVMILICKKRRNFKTSSNALTDLKLLIQTFVIGAYCMLTNVLWHKYKLFGLDNKYGGMALNFIWIFNGAVTPVVYLIVNAAIRKNSRMRNFAKKPVTTANNAMNKTVMSTTRKNPKLATTISTITKASMKTRTKSTPKVIRINNKKKGSKISPRS